MIPFAFIGNLGLPELLIILLIAILLFGHRLPGVGRAMGRSVNEFKAGYKNGKEKGGEPTVGSAEKKDAGTAE